MSRKEKHQRLFETVLCSVFIALIAVMTFTPNFGYLSVGVIEITTIQIVAAIGAFILGPIYAAILGFSWGILCLIRATTNPLWVMFVNPAISVIPRILAILAAYGIFRLLAKTKLPLAVRAAIGGGTASLANTIFVISAMSIFGEHTNFYADAWSTVKSILSTIIGVNGLVELAASVIIVPLIYTAISVPLKRYMKNR